MISLYGSLTPFMCKLHYFVRGWAIEEEPVPDGVMPLGFTHLAQINYLGSFTGSSKLSDKENVKKKSHFSYPAALQASRTGKLPKLGGDIASMLAWSWNEGTADGKGPWDPLRAAWWQQEPPRDGQAA